MIFVFTVNLNKLTFSYNNTVYTQLMMYYFWSNGAMTDFIYLWYIVLTNTNECSKIPIIYQQLEQVIIYTNI